jgi:hypothetical protein
VFCNSHERLEKVTSEEGNKTIASYLVEPLKKVCVILATWVGSASRSRGKWLLQDWTTFLVLNQYSSLRYYFFLK